VPCAIWSPDGNWAALGGGGAVWVVDTNSGEVRELSGYHPTDLEWRPGTDQLAITGEQATRQAPATDAPVDIYTVSTGQIRTLGAARAINLTWSPDGTTLAFTHGEDQPDSGIWLVNADGTDERQLTEHLGVVLHGTGVTWSPNGDVIAYERQCPGCREPHEVVLVTATVDDADKPIGSETVIAPPRTETATSSSAWYPYNIVWSPDGTHLLYFAWADSGGSGVIAVPVGTAGPPTVVTELTVAVYDAAPWIPLQPWSGPSD
jgi:Tol biopolymer transport system component